MKNLKIPLIGFLILPFTGYLAHGGHRTKRILKDYPNAITAGFGLGGIGE